MIEMANELDIIAQNVKRERLARGWTQTRLGREVAMVHPDLKAMPPARIAEIEAGRNDVRIGTLARIASALGVPVATLVIPVETESTVS